MVVLVVQPHQHGRVPGNGHKNVLEAAHSQLTELVQLVDDNPGLDRLGRPRCENPVPEQGHLFLERVLGLDHAVDPVRIASRAISEVRLVDEIPADEVGWHYVGAGGIQQLIDGGVVPQFHISTKLVSCCAKAGPPHQMGHELQILL